MNGDLTYILPIRTRPGDRDDDPLTEYLAWLGDRTDLVVVDGSDPPSFAAHHAAWGAFSRHVPPDEDLRCTNGKVWGVLTGLRLARHERIVIADEDVRYDGEGLDAIARLLDGAELVRPQNYFEPRPWHARWDTARMLVNRSVGNDFPGTLGVRRSFLRSVGGYDGNVLFENLELIRTVRAGGGRVRDAPSLFVRRMPPSVSRFLEQRPRQAYDDWAQPPRFVASLAVGPLALFLARRSPRALAALAVATVLAAAAGRLRNRGAEVFDRVSTLFAPAWVCERAILSWVALGRRIVWGGCPYAGTIIRRAANPSRTLRRDLAQPGAD